ncbi:MAG TPA: ATP-binding protein [Planctomycetota bacterium]|nr:ATP-binding protein [Planctomycetota bacterium]
MDELIFISGRQRGKRIALNRKQPMSMGRNRSNDLPVEDEAASRHHAQVTWKSDQFIVEDLNSSNGTYLNDERVTQPMPIRHGDRLAIGDTVMLFQLQLSAEPLANVVLSDDPALGAAEHAPMQVSDSAFQFSSSSADDAEDIRREFMSLYEFALEVSGALNMQRVMDMLLEHLFKAVRSDRGIIMFPESYDKHAALIVRATRMSDNARQVFADSNSNKRTVARAKIDINEIRRAGQEMGSSNQILAYADEVQISKTVTQQVLSTGQAVLMVDPAANTSLTQTHTFKKFNVLSLICVPLKVKDRILGLLYLDRLGMGRPYTQNDLKLCVAMALQAAQCLENTRLYEDLMNSIEYSGSIMRGLSSGIVVVSMQGVITQVNAAALQILEMEEGDLIDRPVTEIPGIEELSSTVAQTLRTGLPQDRREIPIHVKGQEIPIGLSTSLLEDHLGRPIGAIANFRNISVIKKLGEQAKRAKYLASLGEMAAGVAHEIRNPLNAIRGFAQLLNDKQVDAEPREWTGIIIEEVDRMNRIVTDMLDFSRQRPMTLLPVDLDQILQQVLKELQAQFETAQVQVDYAWDPQLPPALGNADKLKQVFLNVIRNGVEAMPGGGRMRIRGRVESAVEGEGREVIVAIADNGIGMNEDTLGKIFDPFFTKKDTGTGLGLSICAKIIEQHNGRIEVHSQTGKGTLFDVVLTVAQVAGTPPAGGADPGAAATNSAGKITHPKAVT